MNLLRFVLDSSLDDLNESVQLSVTYPLRDYRERLREKGIDTTGFRPMGSAEGTMSVFAKRLENGRSWCDIGLEKMSDAMVALMDNLMIKTLSGSIQKEKDIDENKAKEKPPKHFVEKLTKHVGEATRNNLAYLQGTIRKPIAIALKGLKGF